MGYAHDQGLVHRDLKPANVLLAPMSGTTYLPKVTDFGIVKVLQSWQAERGGPATQTGVAMGTPAYMAPEQLESTRTVDARADIFALGCILYELVCGEPAFSGPTTLAVMVKAQEGEYVDPAEVAQGVDERFYKAIRSCLVPDPELRIPDCATLARVLAGDASVPGFTPPIPARRAKKTFDFEDAPAPARRRGGWGLPMLLGAVLGVGLLVVLVGVLLVGVLGGGAAALVFSRAPSTPAVTILADTADSTVPEEEEAAVEMPVYDLGASHAFPPLEVEAHAVRRVHRTSHSVFEKVAQDGHTLLLVKVTVRNESDEGIIPSDPFLLHAPDGTEYSSDVKCQMSMAEPYEKLTEVPPGGEVTGEACFEVPRKAKNFVLTFQPDLIDDTKRVGFRIP